MVTYSVAAGGGYLALAEAQIGDVGCAAAVALTNEPSRMHSDVAIVADLERQASHILPAHCLPDSIKIVDGFPLTDRGKVDMKSLVATTTAAEEPWSTTISGWTEWVAGAAIHAVIGDGGRSASVGSGLFSSSGGSLQAMKLVSVIRDVVGVDVSTEAVLRARTPRDIADALVEAEASARSRPVIDSTAVRTLSSLKSTSPREVFDQLVALSMNSHSTSAVRLLVTESDASPLWVSRDIRDQLDPSNTGGSMTDEIALRSIADLVFDVAAGDEGSPKDLLIAYGNDGDRR